MKPRVPLRTSVLALNTMSVSTLLKTIWRVILSQPPLDQVRPHL